MYTVHLHLRFAMIVNVAMAVYRRRRHGSWMLQRLLLGLVISPACLKDAQCFCCSNRHRHPQTGERLPCDRKLVYNTLRQWYLDHWCIEVCIFDILFKVLCEILALLGKRIVMLCAQRGPFTCPGMLARRATTIWKGVDLGFLSGSLQ